MKTLSLLELNKYVKERDRINILISQQTILPIIPS